MRLIIFPRGVRASRAPPPFALRHKKAETSGEGPGHRMRWCALRSPPAAHTGKAKAILLVQQHLNPRALAGLGADGQQAPVAVDDVLDDGEAETGALLLAARLGVDPIEPLGQPRDMFG